MSRHGSTAPHPAVNERATGPAGLHLPTGWRMLQHHDVGPFTTSAVLESPDGEQVEWTSRRHRKGLGFAARRDGARPLRRASATSWWIGALFAIGSICFAVGSLPLFFDHVDPAVDAWTFFVGSIFFTSAAFLQFHESASAPTGVTPDSPRPRRLAALVGWRPRSIDWWAGAVQLVGTVWFNVSTFAATRADLSAGQVRHLVWAPDVWGSICFLVASWLAYSEANHRVLPRPDGSVGWWIAALNMVGSIAFGLSAIGARALRTTGETANIALVNTGTFLGAVCFLVGAVLLPVESARDRASGAT